MKKALVRAIVSRNRTDARGDVIKTRGRLVLPPQRELWRMQWDEYSGSRMKQFAVR